MSENEKYMEDDFNVKSNIPDASLYVGIYYQETTENGNTFTFKKFTDAEPYGWQQVDNSDYPSDKDEA